MPGLCVVAQRTGAPAGALVDVMLKRMCHYPWLVADARASSTPGTALGVVSLDVRRSQTSATSADGRVHLVLDGEFHDVARERQRLETIGRQFTSGNAAEVLLFGWLHERTAFVARLNGLWSAAIVDDIRGEVVVLTDRFGLRPTYVTQAGDTFAAASEIKSLLAVPGVDRAWSDTGLAQFFSFGHFWNDDTFYRGVRALGPATCAVFHVASGRLDESQYAAAQPTKGEGSDADLSRAFDDSLVAATSRRAAAGEKLGLSLSGGLDARTLLGVAPDGLNLKTVSLGMKGSIDHRGASRLAGLAGVSHHEYYLDASFLGAFETHLRQMVRLTDGHYLDQGIVMTTLPLYRELGIEYLLRGHAGELAHMRKAYAYSLQDSIVGGTDAELEAWLAHRLTAYMVEGTPADLFVADVPALTRASLRKALGHTETARAPIDRVWPLFLQQRLHRETALSMHKFGCFATVRMPYLDNDVIGSLFSMPASMKLGEQLQLAVLRHRRPDFVGVINSNTGDSMGAGPLATSLAHFRMRVGAKLGLPGYQPYERLGLWLRRDLRPLVERVVLGDAFLARGICRPDVVRAVVDAHMTGKANHTFLLMGMMIFEMGQEMAGQTT